MDRDLAEQHRRACDDVSRRMELVGDDQWGFPTPCTEWDVRALVAHLVSGTSWVAPLVEGMTIAEVGDRFDGDLLGADPKGAWHRAAVAAVAACDAAVGLDRTVHLSFGDTTPDDYISERVLDLAMHAWDLARAIGADESLDPVVVEKASKVLAEKADLWRAAGALGPAIETQPGADAQTELLAASGRKV